MVEHDSVSGPDLFRQQIAAPVPFTVFFKTPRRNEQDPTFKNSGCILRTCSMTSNDLDDHKHLFREVKRGKGFQYLPTVLAHAASHLET